LGAILTAAMLLRYSAGLEEEAAAIEAAVKQVVADGYRTADLARGDKAARVSSTTEMGSKVREFLVGARGASLVTRERLHKGRFASSAGTEQRLVVMAGNPKTLFEKVWESHIVAEPQE
jgi:hypothetical protein